jgi:hypothetical protein
MTVRSPQRIPSVLFLSLVLSAVAGCGGGTKPIPVKGKVTLDSTALTSGSVTYHPDESKGNKLGSPPVGTINEQGEYTLTYANKEGCPPGHYKVTVNASVPSNPKDPYSLPRSIINKRFADAQTTTLLVEVKSDAAAGAYDLPVTK